MILKKRHLSRRTILRGILGGTSVAIGLPILEAMMDSHGEALAGGQPFPTRFGVFFWGNGTALPNWVPATEGPGFSPSPILQPFEDRGVLQDITIVSGMEFKFENTAVHDVGRASMLSGSYDMNAPTWGLIGNATLPSVDQIAADHLAQGTVFRSIEVGVSKQGFGGVQDTNSVSWVDPISPLPAEFSPHNLFERLFGAGFNPDEELRDSRLSVLDVVARDTIALQQRLGSVDKQRLEAHLDGVRAIENKLVSSPPVCVLPSNPGDFPPLTNNNEQLAEIAHAMADLLTHAIACDLTRVFDFRFHQMLADTYFWQVESMEGFHTLTHTDIEQTTVTPILTFVMDQLAYFLERLASVQEGAQSLLDRVVIYGTSDVAEGYSHEYRDMPIIIAGHGNGSIRTGIHYRSQGENTSMVPFTLLKAIGAPVDSFGENAGLVTTTLSAIEA